MVMAGRGMRENRVRRKVREIGLGEKCQRGLCEAKGDERGRYEFGLTVTVSLLGEKKTIYIDIPLQSM